MGQVINHLETQQRRGRSTTTHSPVALQAVQLQQRLGTGCRSKWHSAIPSWCPQAMCHARTNPHLTAGQCSQFLPPQGALQAPSQTGLNWGRRFFPDSLLIPTALQRHHRHRAWSQGASMWLKGRKRKEVLQVVCRHEGQGE